MMASLRSNCVILEICVLSIMKCLAEGHTTMRGEMPAPLVVPLNFAHIYLTLYLNPEAISGT